MSSTVMIFLGLAVILAACFAATWYLDTRRAAGLRGPTHHERPLDLERLHADEEQFAELSTDPRNRMR
jgi:hypothetical protein